MSFLVDRADRTSSPAVVYLVVGCPRLRRGGALRRLRAARARPRCIDRRLPREPGAHQHRRALRGRRRRAIVGRLGRLPRRRRASGRGCSTVRILRKRRRAAIEPGARGARATRRDLRVPRPLHRLLPRGGPWARRDVGPCATGASSSPTRQAGCAGAAATPCSATSPATPTQRVEHYSTYAAIGVAVLVVGLASVLVRRQAHASDAPTSRRVEAAEGAVGRQVDAPPTPRRGQRRPRAAASTAAGTATVHVAAVLLDVEAGRPVPPSGPVEATRP